MGQEADRTLLEFGGQTGPYLGGPHGWIDADDLTSHDEPSLQQQDTGERRAHHSASSGGWCRSYGGLLGGWALLSTEVIEEGDHLAEPLEIEQRDDPSRRGGLRGGRISVTKIDQSHLSEIESLIENISKHYYPPRGETASSEELS